VRPASQELRQRTVQGAREDSGSERSLLDEPAPREQIVRDLDRKRFETSSPMKRALLILVLACVPLGGCASIIRQEMQARVGACRDDMKRYREQFGDPSETESEEDDLREGPALYTVHWIYDREDLNVSFEWEEGEGYCRVRRNTRPR
jgi:hypothetical protein